MLVRGFSDMAPVRPDLIPQSTWGLSASKRLPRSQWAKVRDHALLKAGGHCTSCGASELLSIDEVWSYDEAQGIQSLEEVRALCKDCHDIRHWGRTSRIVGSERKRFLALKCMELNGWNTTEFALAVDAAQRDWERRNALSLCVDISGLRELGIVTQPSIEAERASAVWPSGELSFSCVNCGAKFADHGGLRLFCTDLCQKTAEFVRYARRVRSDGRIEHEDVKQYLIGTIEMFPDPRALEERFSSEMPMRPCDDHEKWNEVRKKLMADHRAALRKVK